MAHSVRICGLDGLRAISIALVLYCHAREGYWLSANASFGVSVFFVISGFLITWLLCAEEEKTNTISLPSFYVRRAIRILPPAFLFLAVVGILGALKMADVQGGDLLRSVLFVRNLVPGGVHTGHFWSLSIEEQFYLFWPLIFLLLGNNARRLAFVVALFSVWPLWYYYRFHHQANAFAFDIRCAYLLAGCGLALGHYSGWPARLLLSRFTRRAVVPAFGVLLIYLVNARWFPVGCLVPTGEAIGIAAIINYAVQQRTVLDLAPLVWIGNLSYSLYLWQQLFCYRSELGWFGRLPENVLAAVAASALSFYLLEQPLAKFRRGIQSIPNPRFLERRKAPFRVAHPIPRPENSTVQTVAN